MRPSLQTRTATLGYALLAPAVFLVLALMVFPVAVAIDFSVRSGKPLSLVDLGQLPLSLEQYQRVFANPDTWTSLLLSGVYTVGVTAPSLLIGLGLALLLNQRLLPIRRVFRVGLLLPWAVPGVIAVIVFLWMFDQAYGVMNYILTSLHLIASPIAWFFNPSTAMLSEVIATTWKGYPFFTVVILAALQSIPNELYEAAAVDGATSVQQFRSITWPGIRSPVVLGTILTALWVFREYDFIYATTQGGPDNATNTLAISVYNVAFKFFNFGQASVLGIICLTIAAVVVLFAAPRLRNQFF